MKCANFHFSLPPPPASFFDSSFIWLDPQYTPIYPRFTPEGELDPTDTAWLEPRPEMDFSPFSPADLVELRTGLSDIVTHFASPAFWQLFARQFLNFHRLSDCQLVDGTMYLLKAVADAFGPHPFLARLESYVAALVRAGTTAHAEADGVVEFVGPTLAEEVLLAIATGSSSWPREARLAVFSATIPRLMVAIEAACLFASARPTNRSSGEGAHRALDRVQFTSVSLAYGNGGKLR